MIEMENITKSFPWQGKEVNVLNGISIFIGKGEFVSIMGPSGSGKSTLSSLLGCLASPSSGVYKINGKNVARYTDSQLAKLRNRKIGFIFQDFNLLDGLSAAENVALPLFYSGIPPLDRIKRANEALKLVGLGDRLKHRPSQLSGGQKQRVAVARAIVNEPNFLFADEPTGALDPKTGEEIMGLMQRLNLMGHTIVQVTHSPHHSLYSRRILHIVSGSIVKDDLVENPTVGAFALQSGTNSELLSRIWKLGQAKNVQKNDWIPSLVKLYDHSKSSPAVLMECVKSLVVIDHSVSDEILLELANHDFWGVRAELIRNAGTRTKEKALKIWMHGLEDTNTWVKFLSVQQVSKHWPLPVFLDQRNRIIALLEDKDERVRAAAVTLIGRWKEKDLLPQILKASRDSNGRVRANALDWLLVFQKEGWEFNSELSYLEDKNNRAKANACLLLFRSHPNEALETLKKMLVSENNLMRASSAWAAGRIPHSEIGPFILECLKGESDPMVLSQLIGSLSKLGEKEYPVSLQLTRLLSSLEGVPEKEAA